MNVYVAKIIFVLICFISSVKATSNPRDFSEMFDKFATNIVGKSIAKGAIKMFDVLKTKAGFYSLEKELKTYSETCGKVNWLQERIVKLDDFQSKILKELYSFKGSEDDSKRVTDRNMKFLFMMAKQRFREERDRLNQKPNQKPRCSLKGEDQFSDWQVVKDLKKAFRGESVIQDKKFRVKFTTERKNQNSVLNPSISCESTEGFMFKSTKRETCDLVLSEFLAADPKFGCCDVVKDEIRKSGLKEFLIEHDLPTCRRKICWCLESGTWMREFDDYGFCGCAGIFVSEIPDVYGVMSLLEEEDLIYDGCTFQIFYLREERITLKCTKTEDGSYEISPMEIFSNENKNYCNFQVGSEIKDRREDMKQFLKPFFPELIGKLEVEKLERQEKKKTKKIKLNLDFGYNQRH